MKIRARVGKNCARLRQERSLTQKQLAEKSGISQQYISDLERGKRNPTVRQLEELALALKVPIVELAAGETFGSIEPPN